MSNPTSREEYDQRRQARRDAQLIAVKIVLGRHLPENPTVDDLDPERFYVRRVLSDAKLYAEVSHLATVLYDFGARHRQEMEEAKRALEAERGELAVTKRLFENITVRAEAAEQREREAGGREEARIFAGQHLAAIVRQYMIDSERIAPAFGADVSAHTAVMREALDAWSAAIRSAPFPVSAPPADPRDDLLEFAWGVIANAGRGDWTQESDEWREAAARFRTRWHTLIGAGALLPTPAPEPSCPNALLPDGPFCPRCGRPRLPSGIDGGSWVHAGTPPETGEKEKP